MQSQPSLSLKKLFLYSLIGSVSLSALLGIAVILLGDFGDVEVRILLTSLTIAAASLCGVSCGAVLETGRTRTLPTAGIGSSLLAALLIVVGIWTKTSSELFWKTTATAAIFALACTHMTLLYLARLNPRYAWAMKVAYGAVFGVAAILTVMIWGEVDDEPLMRLLGVASIVDGAITILIPVYHRLSRGDFGESDGSKPRRTLEDIDREIGELQVRLEQLERLREESLLPSERVTTANSDICASRR